MPRDAFADFPTTHATFLTRCLDDPSAQARAEVRNHLMTRYRVPLVDDDRTDSYAPLHRRYFDGVGIAGLVGREVPSDGSPGFHRHVIPVGP